MSERGCPICGHATRVWTDERVPEWVGRRECTVCSWIEDGEVSE